MKPFKDHYVLIFIVVMAFGLLFTACSQPTLVSPISPLTVDLSQSPLKTPITQQPVDSIVPFLINRPIRAQTKKITGTGPAEIPIILANITLGGDILAVTTIDKNGRFEFVLNQLLESGTRIGITIADLSTTNRTFKDFEDERYYGIEPRLVPQVGFFFDTALITE